MADLDRMVAGLRCDEVLGRLSDYMDGEVSPEDRSRIEEHLKGCDRCERFGGRMSSIVKGLRDALREPDPLEEGVSRRLLDRLNRELGLP
jgi:anti-sigma factor RsiW